MERNELKMTYSEQIYAMDTLDILEQELITGDDVFNKWADLVTKYNWEGFMIRKDSTYIGDRSKELLKVKTMMDAEYVVIATTPGEIRHIVWNALLEKKEEITSTMVSNLIIEHKGNKVDVGSGLSLQQRQDFYADPSRIIGKTITVQYFEETTNESGTVSLRFPVLKFVYENGRQV
jgi:DNA ligase-1